MIDNYDLWTYEGVIYTWKWLERVALKNSYWGNGSILRRGVLKKHWINGVFTWFMFKSPGWVFR